MSNTQSPVSHTEYITPRGLLLAGFMVSPLLLTVVIEPNIGLVLGRRGWMVFIAIVTWYLVMRLGWQFHVVTWEELRHGRFVPDALVTLGIEAVLLWSTYALVVGGERMYFEVAGVIMFSLLFTRWLKARLPRRAGRPVDDKSEQV